MAQLSAPAARSRFASTASPARPVVHRQPCPRAGDRRPLGSCCRRMSGSPHNAGLGAYGERVAAQRLVDEGMVLVDRNWRCERGEIDLVLRDGDVLVFCEVKTRTSAAYGHPLEAVSPAKGERLRQLAAVLGRAARRASGRHPDRPGRGAARRARRSPRSSTSGGWADGRHHPHRVAPGRGRPRGRRPGRPLRRPHRDRHWWAGRTPRSWRPATGAARRSPTAA